MTIKKSRLTKSQNILADGNDKDDGHSGRKYAYTITL